MSNKTSNDVKSSFSSFEPTEKIEEFLVGFLFFGRKVLSTLFDLAFRQAKFSEALKNSDLGHSYTKPITFITLTSFIALRVFRFGLLTIIMAFLVPSCSTETYIEVSYPSFWDELQIPAFSEIVLYGVPTLVSVLLLAQLLRVFLLKGSDKAQKTILHIAYYSVGFQYVAYLVMILLLYLIFQYEKTENLTYLIVPLFSLWGSWIFFRLVSKSVDHRELRVTRSGFRQVWLMFFSLVLMVSTTALGVYMAYSLAQFEIKDYKRQPRLSLGLVRYESLAPDELVVELMVNNNSNEDIILLPDKVVFGDAREIPCQGKIIDSSAGRVPIIILASHEASWIVLSLEIPSAEGDCFILEENYVTLNSLTPSGTRETITATVNREKEVLGTK